MKTRQDVEDFAKIIADTVLDTIDEYIPSEETLEDMRMCFEYDQQMKNGGI